MSRRRIDPFALGAGGLGVVLVPLLVLPSLRAEEAEPERPGEQAVCPVDEAGAPAAVPLSPAEEASRAATLDQPVPPDGGLPTFERAPDGDVTVVVPELGPGGSDGSVGGADGGGAEGADGGLGGAGAADGGQGAGGSGTDGGPGAGAGTGTGGTGANDGGSGGGDGTGESTDGTTGAAEGTAGGTDGTTGAQGSGAASEPGEPTPSTTTVSPTSTVAPDEVAQEVLEDDQEERSNPWRALLPLLVAAAVAVVVVLLARRRQTGSDELDGEGDEEDTEDLGDDAVDGATGSSARARIAAAIRLRRAFVRGLRALDRARLVPFDPTRPSGAVARRLGRAHRDDFLDASRTFDAVHYGERPATDADVDRVRAAFDRILDGDGAR